MKSIINMKYLSSHSLALSFVAFLGGLSQPAWAVSCDEVVNMLNVNVPEDIVVQTMKDSGASYTQADVECLQKAGVSARVIEQARRMTPQAEEPTRSVEAQVPDEPAGMDADEDILGKKRGKADEIDLEDEIGDKNTGPERLREAKQLYKAKKPLTASLMLYDMLQEGAYPEYEDQIFFYLAGCLTQLEMYHAAQYYYLKVIKTGGPNNPYFNYALPKLVSIADITGDDAELRKLVRAIPPEAFPRAARNHLNYLMGVRKFESDDLTAARKYFGQVGTKSSLYLKAQYFSGVIYNKQDKLKAAVRAFRDVNQAENFEVASPRDYEEVERLQELALLNIARIYYEIERFDDASQYYDLVNRESVYWPEALFESAWAHFMKNDLNNALGKILTVQSNFFRNDEFLPEAIILQALTFFNLCEYTEVERILLRFEDTHRPMLDEMESFVMSYATDEGKAVADQAFDQYFGPKRIESTLPKALFNRILRNEDLASFIRHMDLMDAEMELIDEQKAQWRNSVGVHLKQIIENDKQKYKRRAGLLFLKEMARNVNYLRDLLTQSEIIRFEVVDAQRVDYQYKMRNETLADSSNEFDIDFATDVEVIYWPFNGEFWEDELGYYQYTEQSSCN